MDTDSDRTSASSWQDVASLPFLVLLVATALLAQRLVLDPEYQSWGWVLFTWVAILTAAIAPHRSAGVTLAPDSAAVWPVRTRRVLWIGATIAMVVAVTWLTETSRLPLLALAMWLFAFVSASIAVAGLRVTPGLAQALPFTTREFALIAAIVALAALARFSWLDTLPFYYFNDEPRVGAYLLNRLRGAPIEFFRMGWNTWSGLGLWLQGMFVPVLGLNLVTLRLSSALMGTLSVLTTYLLTRELLGKRAAWIAAILLAIGRTSIDFSRLGVCHAQVMLFGTFAFWCWWRAVNTGSALSYLWAGIGLGWGLYSYNAGYLLPVIWGGWVVLCALAAPRVIATHWRGAALTLGGFLLSTFVYLVYVTDHFTFQRMWYEWTYMARNRQVLGRILDVWQAEGFGAMLTPLWDQVWRTWLGFTVLPDSSYGIGYRAGGMLDHITGPLFVLGLAVAAVGVRSRRFFLFYWWLPTSVLGGVLTDNPPSSWRLVGLVPLLAIVASLPLDAIVAATRRRRPLHALAVGLVVVLLAAAAWDNWRSYFVEFGNSDSMLDLSSALSHDIEAAAPDTQVIVFGPDGSLNVHSELFEVNFGRDRLTDVAEASTFLPIRIPLRVPLLLVLAPLQTAMVDQVRDMYPGAVIRDRTRQSDQQLMYRLVELTPQQLEGRTGLSLVGGGALSTPADPFAPLPAELADKPLRWSGRVFWSSDRPLSVQLRSAAPVVLRFGEDAELRGSGPEPVTATVQMARGWQLFRLEEEQASAEARPSVALTLKETPQPLNRWDLRPDAVGDGLRVRYEHDGTVLLDSVEPQLNLCTMEPLFARESLAVTLPFVASWNGSLQLAESGLYEFEVRSSAPYTVELDGSALCNELRIALVGPVACVISRELTAGRHDLSAWWDGSDTTMIAHHVLQLKWRQPGTEEFRLVPPENLGG